MDEEPSRSNWDLAVEAQALGYLREVLYIVRRYVDIWGKMPTERDVLEHLKGKRALF